MKNNMEGIRGGEFLPDKNHNKFMQELDDYISSRVDVEVKPACDEQILQAKIDENEHWLKVLNADASNIIHKTSLMDRVRFLENENRKSV